VQEVGALGFVSARYRTSHFKCWYLKPNRADIFTGLVHRSVASPKFWEGSNMFDFKRATVFGVVHCLSKHKTTRATNLWGMAPLPPLATPMLVHVAFYV